MANNDKFLMHQMEAKGKRLAFGLNKIVEMLESKDQDFNLTYAHALALACLGDEKSKAKVLKMQFCADVYERLKSEKLVKPETADKMIAENAKKLAAKNEDKEPKPVESSMQKLKTQTDKPLDSFCLKYDQAARHAFGFEGDMNGRIAYDRLLEYFQASRKFPMEFLTDDKTVWIRDRIETLGPGTFKITYRKES